MEVEDLSAIVRVIEDREVDVIVNDVLDTLFEDVEFLRSTNRVVVNFEDRTRLHMRGSDHQCAV